ncbi:MAG: alpha-galactosidase [Kiritimatiellae bacterium]|jgi:alpha-galactosidase|nr:alpha-galactosidase [Kiritimatiellia bacterium]
MLKMVKVLSVLVFVLQSAVFAGDLNFNGCYASWNEAQITVGNKRFERVWVCGDKGLKATSFVLKGVPEIVLAQDSKPKKSCNTLDVKAVKGRRSIVGSEGIKLELAVKGINQRLVMWLYPEAGGVLMQQLSGEVDSKDSSEKVVATGSESATKEGKGKSIAGADTLKFKSIHLRVNEIELMDQTDRHDELVFEREWLLMLNEAGFDIKGCVLNVEDMMSGCGAAFVKFAPLPHARHDKTSIDFKVDPRRNSVSAMLGEAPSAVISYRGGRIGFTKAMHDFQRCLRNYKAGRDGLFLSNTWGDRSRDARIKEAFLLKEVAAGAKLGVDIVQIDDGWQKGRSANSVASRGNGVWNGYWAADPEFWNADPDRFPNGLECVVDAAKKNGMHFGLWFGPDSSNSASNWKKDADHLLDFYKMGVSYFKIDSMKSHDAISLNNQRAMFDRMLEGSDGNMVFDLDVTAEIRPGYFGLPDIGPLFVENRYTDFHRYWPHQTLRNLWKLAQVVDPVRLRMELLNNIRNADKYKDDPLAPALYRPDTLFAITMMASPLGWFEVSNLPAEYVKQMQPLVASWKQERARMHGGNIIPVGGVPDGLSWTGFASVAADNSGGYLLLFRELNADQKFELSLNGLFEGKLKASVIGGRGKAELDEGDLEVEVPEKLDYIWVKLTL